MKSHGAAIDMAVLLAHDGRLIREGMPVSQERRPASWRPTTCNRIWRRFQPAT